MNCLVKSNPVGLQRSAYCTDATHAAQRFCHVATATACESKVHASALPAIHMSVRSQCTHMTGAVGGLRPMSLCCAVQAAYPALQIGPGHLLATSDAKILLANLALPVWICHICPISTLAGKVTPPSKGQPAASGNTISKDQPFTQR